MDFIKQPTFDFPVPASNAAVRLQKYWGFSFKSTGGVTRDPFFEFDISTPAKIWRDTPQNFDKSHGNFRFFASFRRFWTRRDQRQVRQGPP
jgi:hypothetical protein